MRRLHVQQARRGVAAARGQGETLPALALDPHAKALQQIQGDVYIRFADEFAHHLDDDVLAFRHQRQRQQQGREKLAGHIAAHLDRRVELQALMAFEMQRRVAVLAGVVNVATELAQRIHQVANRALVHAWHTM